MIKKGNQRNAARLKRHRRLRSGLSGTQDRPRLCVFRSTNHIYAQIINDDKCVTLVTASSRSQSFQGQMKNGGNIAAAKKVGELVATEALKRGIKQVVFDRGGYLYHGRVKALADAAREHGLQF
ncbi:50S ribosomal protein L18 [bacterium]|nr:50S ribosomal protein L18 [bacterium]